MQPADSRLHAKLRTLNDKDFFLRVPATKEAWLKRRQAVREQMLVATGLWPLPDKTPLKPVIHGKIDRDDYTIEKVFFASYPGHYVSGNLYRPKEQDPGKLPGVLCPHGHWANGRFFEADDKTVAAQIKQGAEKTPEGAKYPLQARCAQLARMGCVVFHYDMVGYADSTAIDASRRLHRRRGRTAVAELHGPANLEQHPRPRFPAESAGRRCAPHRRHRRQRRRHADVHALRHRRSPGGRLSRRDGLHGRCRAAASARTARICASAPATSSSPALFAPKPLGMSGANDWTIDIERKGLPELKELYKLYGAEDRVMAQLLPAVRAQLQPGQPGSHVQLVQ